MKDLVCRLFSARSSGAAAAGRVSCLALAIALVLCPLLFADPASAASLTGSGAPNYDDGAALGKAPASSKRAKNIVKAKVSRIKAVTYTGSAVKPKPKVYYGKKRLEAGRDYRLSYRFNVDVGTAKVKVIGKGSYTGSKTLTFKIVKAPASMLSVAGIRDRTYSGSRIKPSPAVTYNGKKLKKGVDYTLSYTSNVNAGKATVKVVCQGNFAGAKKARFKITPASLAEAKVSSIPASYTTGLSAVKPSPTVKLNGRTLAKGVDYRLSYKGNVQPGTALVTVKAKSANYTDVVSKKFKLVNLGDDLARTACRISYSCKVKGGAGTERYIAACKEAGCYFSPYYGRSCIFGVCTAIRASGYDEGFPKYNWDSRWSVLSARSYFHYLRKGERSSDTSCKSSKWTCVGTYPEDKDKLLPGDVLLILHANDSGANHIWMYVGDEIAKEVYKKSLKGTDADKGAPTGAWVQGHGSSKSAPSIEGPNDSFNNKSNPVRIYRCTSPMCK